MILLKIVKILRSINEYLFCIEDEQTIKIDETEMGGYKWISEQELAEDKNFGKIIRKLKVMLEN